MYWTNLANLTQVQSPCEEAATQACKFIRRGSREANKNIQLSVGYDDRLERNVKYQCALRRYLTETEYRDHWKKLTELRFRLNPWYAALDLLHQAQGSWG